MVDTKTKMYLMHGVGKYERDSNEKSHLYRHVFATDREIFKAGQISRKSQLHASDCFINKTLPFKEAFVRFSRRMTRPFNGVRPWTASQIGGPWVLSLRESHWKQIPKNQACIDRCVETSCDFLQSLTKDLSLENFKIILQATDLPALTRSDPVSLIEDILMAASEGDKN